jgi:hypothetical protein
MRKLSRACVAILLLSVAGYGILQASRLARAELLARRDTIPDLEAAAALEPADADYHARIAAIDASRETELTIALQRNPWAPSWWILQSVRQEQDGDVAGAERSLLRANQVSRYYVPRWSLAAFYYRQQNRPKFEEWARAALSVGYGAPDSLFRMAQRLGLSADDILRAIVPDDPEKIEAFLRLALSDADPDAARLAALRLLAVGAQQTLPAVLDVSDALFRAARISDAADLWNRAVHANWLAAGLIDPDAGKATASDQPGKPGVGRSFDWRHPAVEGVAPSTSDADGALRLEFSGKEPESCELLSQYVALRPGGRYEASIRYRLDGIAPGAGLRLAVEPLAGGPPALDDLLTAAGEDIQEQTFPFTAPSQPVPAKLALRYARSSGTTRIEGRLSVQSIKLRLLL